MKKQQKYNGRYCTSHSKGGRSRKSLLSVALVLILAVCLTIGGTLAFLQEKTGTVKNSFVAGKIEYTLELIANAKNANEKYKDEDVSMPTHLDAQETSKLSVAFTPDAEPALEGYTFSGWYYDEACETVYPHVSDAHPGVITVNYGDTHDKNSKPNKVEIDLYADWKANQYEVVYNGNGSTSGQMENSTHTYDEAKNLTENAYERTGYAFLGWSQDSNATEPTYTDKESVMNLASKDGAKVNLHAVWEANEYKIIYNNNGGAGSMDPTIVKYDEDVSLRKNTFTKTGYIFTGWNTQPDGNGTDYVDEAKVKNLATNGDVTLYAQWTPIKYTVKYVHNVDTTDPSEDVSGNTEISHHTYDVTQKLNKNGFKRVGYDFLAWNTKPDGSGEFYENGEEVTNLTTENGEEVILYAQWGAKTYIIRYHGNGATGGSMANQHIEYGKLVNLTPNAYVKDDYSFAGWALTETGDVEYLDEEAVVNLQETGYLDLYAVWLQDSHIVEFDYNFGAVGGTGAPESKLFQYGKPYGELPKFPMHNPVESSEKDKWLNYLFTGWYTDPTGGTRVYSSTTANTTNDHTLYAHWEAAPSNNVIKNMQVYNNPDDNFDGIADDVHLKFTCSDNFEKFNIPINNLIPGQTYKITYNASNTASFGDGFGGYGNSVYGSYIVQSNELKIGRIDQLGTLGKDYFGIDLLATWGSRIEPDGNNDGSQAAINDDYLNGPWNDRTITFTATAQKMYWVWDFGLMQDHIPNEYSITDIVLEPVAPKINFASKTLLRPQNYNAVIKSQSNDTYSTVFEFDGDGGCETIYYPITGLNKGSQYTITFDHVFTGGFVNSASYEYGCGIMNAKPAENAMGSKMSSLGTWASNTYVCNTLNVKRSVTLTFTAEGDTAYWVWNMANSTDSQITKTEVNVTKFSAHHKDGDITYYESSNPVILKLMPNRNNIHEIELFFDGIDDTNMELWYPVDEQNPLAFCDYELAFEPLEGFTMCEKILVTIDDVTYEVYTDGTATGEDDKPGFDPQKNILIIPGMLLSQDTTSVSITASAVEIISEETTEPSTEATEPSTEATEPSTEATEPSTEATEPSTEATEPSTEATEPSTEATEPSTEATEPSTEATEPSTEATEPSTEATEPSTEATEPSTEATEPSTEATEPSTEATDPSLEGNDGENVIDNFFDMIQKKKITNINQISDNDDVDPDEEVGE